MPGRRSFLIGCGALVAAPAFAEVAQPSATGDVPLAVAPVAIAVPAALNENLALRVAGWDLAADSADSKSATPLISINSSWHAAWR